MNEQRPGTIPTASNPRRFELSNGNGAIYLRRMKASVRDAIASHVGLKEGDSASAMKFGSVALRWGIVKIDGVQDPSGEAKPEQLEHRSSIRNVGQVASEEVYNAVSFEPDDYAAALAIIMGDDPEDLLNPQQRGNSEGSPTGSTDSD